MLKLVTIDAFLELTGSQKLLGICIVEAEEADSENLLNSRLVGNHLRCKKGKALRMLAYFIDGGLFTLKEVEIGRYLQSIILHPDAYHTQFFQEQMHIVLVLHYKLLYSERLIPHILPKGNIFCQLILLYAVYDKAKVKNRYR